MQAFPQGKYVKHSRYGCGVITESNNERTSIDFDLHGIKKFVTRMMVVEPAEGAPPARPRSKRRKSASNQPAPV